MPIIQVEAQMTLDQLFAAVQQLSHEDRRELERRLKQRQTNSANGKARERNGNSQAAKAKETEARLIERAKTDLSEPDLKRLKRLTAKSERGTLTRAELLEYRALAKHAEQIDVVRTEALVKLAQQWNKPIETVMKEIGWKSVNDET